MKFINKQIRNNYWYFFPHKDDQYIVGWGRKSSGNKAVNTALERGGKFLLCEDGMIHSVGSGKNRSNSFSIVKDDVGIYYDANKPSKLENLLNDDDSFKNMDAQEIKYLIQELLSKNISKYNNAPLLTGTEKFVNTEPKILIVGQTLNDQSLIDGMAIMDFDFILDTINTLYPNHKKYVKIHPDVFEGLKQSSIDVVKVRELGIDIIEENYNPIDLLRHFDVVVVQTSGMGFEALLLGKEVLCFGAPYYSGWGLTQDFVSTERRKTQRTVEEVFYATYILYSEYANPFTLKPASLDEVLFLIPYYKRIYDTDKNSKKAYGFGFWKWEFIPSFLLQKKCDFFMFNQPKEGDENLIWGMKNPEIKNCVRVEDGFIRSVGLGGDLTTPYSLAFDRESIYYNGETTSELERILEDDKNFSNKTLIKHAKEVKNLIRTYGISKYNIVLKEDFDIGVKKKIILVVGQVDNDASITYQMNKNIDNKKLLENVRKENPEAFLIYRPHPDVLNGNRTTGLTMEMVKQLCDYISVKEHIHSVIEKSDEVHVISSLSGLEALIYDKKVVCHGTPFYSGWGLTEDRYPIKRKTKRNLHEIVAGTYILYPRYKLPKSQSTFNDVFDVIYHLVQERKNVEKQSRKTLSHLYKIIKMNVLKNTTKLIQRGLFLNRNR
jgi:capsular polysaccharide export protein